MIVDDLNYEEQDDFLKKIPQSILIKILNHDYPDYNHTTNPKTYIAYYLAKRDLTPENFKIILYYISTSERPVMIKEYLKKHDYVDLGLPFYYFYDLIQHLFLFNEGTVALKYIKKNLSLKLIKQLVDIKIRNKVNYKEESIFLYLFPHTIKKIEDLVLEKGDINLLSNFLNLVFEYDADFDIKKLQNRNNLDLLSSTVLKKLIEHEDNEKIFYKTVQSDRFVERFRDKLRPMLNHFSFEMKNPYGLVDVFDIVNVFDKIPFKIKQEILNCIDNAKYWIYSPVSAAKRKHTFIDIKKLIETDDKTFFSKDEEIRKAVDSVIVKADRFLENK